MLGQVGKSLGPKSTSFQSCRFLRARWERGYLKDLYHRRQLLGADPVISRSAYPNWDYSSELFAFAHRIGVPEVSPGTIVQALTSDSFLNRKDVEDGVDVPSPSNSQGFSQDSNVELASKGALFLRSTLSAYLRFHLPQAPEELVQSVVTYLQSDSLLSEISKHIGIDVLIRTGEHPPSASSLANAFRALAGTLEEEGSVRLVLNLIVPQLVDVDFADVFPLSCPLDVLTDLMKADGAHSIEPRLLRSTGELSAHPVFIVGIYKDSTEVIGQSAGETIEVAVDMAAREGLLRLWGLTSDKVFSFGDGASRVCLQDYAKENYRLAEKCGESTDVSLQSYIDNDPINIVEVAMQYKNEVEGVVGKSYTKRLRHKFSRGSLGKRSFRYLVKPKVYTVA